MGQGLSYLFYLTLTSTADKDKANKAPQLHCSLLLHLRLRRFDVRQDLSPSQGKWWQGLIGRTSKMVTAFVTVSPCVCTGTSPILADVEEC